jgi:hypothetical protein
MKTTEIRVRPVVRHVVTRYTSEYDEATKSCGGSCETIGEFDNERFAEEVAKVLQEEAQPKQYAVVESTLGDIQAQVYYAEGQREAFELSKKLSAETLKTFRVFERASYRHPGY